MPPLGRDQYALVEQTLILVERHRLGRDDLIVTGVVADLHDPQPRWDICDAICPAELPDLLGIGVDRDAPRRFDQPGGPVEPHIGATGLQTVPTSIILDRRHSFTPSPPPPTPT